MIGAGMRYSSQPTQFSCGSERSTSIMLCEEKTTRSGHQPHVKIEHRFMSSTDTRGSIIVGIRQQDPKRWCEFDAIYRPMLFGFLPSKVSTSSMRMTSFKTSS